MLRRDSRSASLLFPDQPIQSPPSFRNRGFIALAKTSRTVLGDPTLFRLPQSQRKTVRHDDQAATRDRFQAQVAFSLIKLPLPLLDRRGGCAVQKNVGVATLFRADGVVDPANLLGNQFQTDPLPNIEQRAGILVSIGYAVFTALS